MRAFGLQNNGVICYFNSLIQGLISCPAFISAVEGDKDGSNIANLMNNFLRSIQNINVSIFTILPVLNAIVNSHKFFGRQQEDASEGFDLLIDKFGPRIESIFTSEWRVDVYCDTCRAIVSQSTDKMNRLIMEQNFIPLYDNHDKFEAYMGANMSEFNDYRCAQCGMSSTRGMKIARLIKPPDIYIVSFNKFINKWNIGYPKVVNVRYTHTYDAIAQYELVAVIRHYGGASGGHYNATVLRESGIVMADDTNISRSMFTCDPNDYILLYIKKKLNL